jgi:hypothetical protein
VHGGVGFVWLVSGLGLYSHPPETITFSTHPNK